MKTILSTLAVVAGALLPVGASVIGPYAPDANTLHLWHLDEEAATGSVADSGSIARTLDTVGGVQGAPAYSGFSSSLAVDNTLGGAYVDEVLAAGDLQSNYQGADGAFTYEAMINLSTLEGADGGIQNIFSRENEGAVAERSFQFRIIPGNLLHMEGIAAGAASVEIPTTGPHGFVAGEWFHVAAAYDGNGTVEFFWTRVDDAFTEANSLGTAAFASLSPTNQGETALGSQNRSSVRNELQGSIDEVRVSDIARGASDFIFGIVESIDLSPKSFLTGVFQGDRIGTLSVPGGDPGDTFTYEIEQGVGDFAKFQIAGDQLQAGANDFTGDPDGSEYVIRISATGVPSNQTYTADFTLTATADSDRDGLPDSWELNPAWANTPDDLTILSGGAHDADMDLLTDTEEYVLSLSQFPTIDPTNPDSDGDDPGDESLFDGAEIDPADARGATDPTASDSEGDGLPDTVETNTGNFVDMDDTGTDPNLEDSDGDGMGDFAELEAGTDPTDPNDFVRAVLGHHWMLDGNAEDAVGSFDGTWAGDEVYGDGRIGQAADFDGVGDAIATLSPAIESGGYTIAAWINPRVNMGDIRYIAGVQQSGNAGGRFIRLLPDGNLHTEFRGVANTAVTGPVIPTDTWTHVAVTLGDPLGGERPLTLYVDGLAVGTTATADPDAITTLANFSIGTRPDINANNLFDGLIDEVRVYAGALRADEVAALANASPEGPRFTAIERAPDGSQVTITWTSRPGASYTIEFSPDMQGWLEVNDSEESQGDMTTLIDTIFAPVYPDRGYYRVWEN